MQNRFWSGIKYWRRATTGDGSACVEYNWASSLAIPDTAVGTDLINADFVIAVCLSSIERVEARCLQSAANASKKVKKVRSIEIQTW